MRPEPSASAAGVASIDSPPLVLGHGHLGLLLLPRSLSYLGSSLLALRGSSPGLVVSLKSLARLDSVALVFYFSHTEPTLFLRGFA